MLVIRRYNLMIFIKRRFICTTPLDIFMSLNLKSALRAKFQPLSKSNFCMKWKVFFSVSCSWYTGNLSGLGMLGSSVMWVSHGSFTVTAVTSGLCVLIIHDTPTPHPCANWQRLPPSRGFHHQIYPNAGNYNYAGMKPNK